MQIPQSFIDELLNRVDIVDVISARLPPDQPLRKAGANYSALCPFHKEKTPSFTVNPRKQFYHCFGCSSSGNAISFLMAHDKCSFPEAIEQLALMVGLTVPTTVTHKHSPIEQKKQDAKSLLEKATHFYQQQLRQHPEAVAAINYLKSRGLTGQLSKQFELGFAPGQWDNLLKAFHPTDETLALWVASGMVIKNEQGKYYDRFRQRIMFPIRNKRGQMIGFGGRVLDDSLPKYLNSPETPWFHKGKELYGFYQAVQSNQSLSSILVVEGYMDVISLHQFGFTQAVATLGTAITQQHIHLLLREVKKIIFCFDGDQAGQQAAWRAAQVALPLMQEAIEINFVFLPEKEDPDSYLRAHSKEQFERLLEQAVPLSRFLLDRFVKDVDLISSDGRARYVELLKPYLLKLPDSLYRHLLIEQISQRVKLSVQQLMRYLGEAKYNNPEKRTRQQSNNYSNYKTNQKPLKIEAILPPTQKAIRLLLQFPDLAADIYNEDEKKWDDECEDIQILKKLLDQLKKRPNMTIGQLLECWRGESFVQKVADLAAKEILLDKEAIKNELIATMAHITEQYAIKPKVNLLAKAKEQGLNNLTDSEKRALQELLRERVNAKE